MVATPENFENKSSQDIINMQSATKITIKEKTCLRIMTLQKNFYRSFIGFCDFLNFFL